jgi:COP9 signalosome complex subunit 4
LSADHKADKYVKIAQLYLEEDEHFEAERFTTKASVLMPDVKEQSIHVRYKACFARISKFKRKFLEAAMRFYELSQLLDPAERLQCLETAIVCAVMAPAGPQRSRQLATLYKDERSMELPVFGILEKMFLDRILRKDEFTKFVQFLKEREEPLATVDGHTTVLDKAVREHNLLSASRVYNNIKFEELALLLDVDADDAEKLASTMISENRMQGHIDQLERIIYFQEQNSLELWDSHIAAACNTVNSLIDLLAAKHPVFLDQVTRAH